MFTVDWFYHFIIDFWPFVADKNQNQFYLATSLSKIAIRDKTINVMEPHLSLSSSARQWMREQTLCFGRHVVFVYSLSVYCMKYIHLASQWPIHVFAVSNTINIESGKLAHRASTYERACSVMIIAFRLLLTPYVIRCTISLGWRQTTHSLNSNGGGVDWTVIRYAFDAE